MATMSGVLLKRSDWLGTWRERQICIRGGSFTWCGPKRSGEFLLDAQVNPYTARVQGDVLIVQLLTWRNEHWQPGRQLLFKAPANSGTSVADWHACIASHTAGGAVVVTAGSEGAPRRRKREPFGVEELGQTSAAGVRVVRLVRERRPTQAAL